MGPLHVPWLFDQATTLYGIMANMSSNVQISDLFKCIKLKVKWKDFSQYLSFELLKYLYNGYQTWDAGLVMLTVAMENQITVTINQQCPLIHLQ